MLEIPAGTLDYVDRAKGFVEDHARAAPRELEEETGYRASSWRRLGEFWRRGAAHQVDDERLHGRGRIADRRD